MNLELGKKQVLTIVKKVDFGVYLGDDNDRVLLPKKQVPAGAEIGDPVEVFLYKDSSDRLIATTHTPKMTLGEAAVLEVLQVGKFGAFLDWGLEKDLFLPFKEQTAKVKPGDHCLVALYIDKSERLCGTMKVYKYLKQDAPYQKDDIVDGLVYESSDNFGMFVAIDDQYSALIPKREVPEGLRVGQRIKARVTEVKADGKINLSVREKAFIQMDRDAEEVLQKLNAFGGSVPFTDKADAEVIKEHFGLSKSAFKRAIGRLYKEHKVELLKNCIKVK